MSKTYQKNLQDVSNLVIMYDQKKICQIMVHLSALIYLRCSYSLGIHDFSTSILPHHVGHQDVLLLQKAPRQLDVPDTGVR